MSSNDFKKVLVKDPRLMTTDQIAYAVEVGAQNMTPAQYNAVSESTSSHTYNINVPSEQTLIDRRCIWKSTVVLQLTGIPAAGQFLVNYGYSDSLSNFPLQSLCSVISSTINNNTVSTNIGDILPALMRFHDKRELSRYNGMTPTAFDTTSEYTSLLGANNNPLGSYANVADNDLVPRGSWVLDGISSTNNFVVPTAQVAGDGVAVRNCFVKFTVAEPLLISPWIWANPQSNNQAFYGIQNLNFQMTIGNANRVWRSATPKTCSVVSFANSQLCFNFLTPKADGSSMLSSRNCVGYYELPRYISTPGVVCAPGASQVLNTSTISLNQIPDSLIIMVKKPQDLLTNTDPDFCLCVEKININFNNSSGILASANVNDLYRYSVENSSNQSYLEFTGAANINDNATGFGKNISTSGSYLMLKFNKDIQIAESYYSSGSLGQFVLQIQLTVRNQTANNITPNIVVITKNSGVWCNERGQSSTYTGLLSKSDVLEATTQEAHSGKDVERMVGGGFLDTLKSVVGTALPILAPLAGNALRNSSNPYAQTAGSVLGSLGMGKSGGGTSGGGMKQTKLQHRLM
jgi:hypothetical protein